MSSALARARANIALAKYWGKCDAQLNLPAVPSISLTLDGLLTETRVTFGGRRLDQVLLDGRPARGSERTRVTEVLDLLRERAGVAEAARVESTNHFPTAAGLASSASGFAALVAAASAALGLRYSAKEISRLARRASASAARSIYGGFVELPAGTPGDDSLSARPLAEVDHWDLRLVVAVTTEGRKAVSSRVGMERARTSSPLYDAWIESAPGIARRVRRAIRSRDLGALGMAMEQSTLCFHATAMTSMPPTLYPRPATIGCLHRLRQLRDRGTEAYATMDAGPHVKAVCLAEDAPRVQRVLSRTPGVVRTLVTRPGPGIEVEA